MSINSKFNMKRLNYDWRLSDGYPSSSKLKVFGTFVCAGGSTMGYKLAGFNHLGGVEIDHRVAEIYKLNHSPKHFYLEDIRTFNHRNDLPDELYDLDILDGSPPCTTFSMCGKREQTWGKVKKFKEGQVAQRLDDLVFVYCDTINKLRPKTAILENVPGILAGKAKGYSIEIVERLNAAGYDVQIFLLNAATMGVPQARERVFFIALRRDLNYPKLVLEFNERPICFGDIIVRDSRNHRPLWPSILKRLPFVEYGDQNLKFADAKFRNKTTFNAFFSTNLLYSHEVPGTLTSSGTSICYDEMRGLDPQELVRMSSFPSDFNFNGMDERYVCGMSVPPLMIARIAEAMKLQWFLNGI